MVVLLCYFATDRHLLVKCICKLSLICCLRLVQVICIEIGGSTLIELIKAILVHSTACLDISHAFDASIQVKAIKLQSSLQS